MFDGLQDILIIDNSGKVLVRRIRHPKIQENLFGMLFSALTSFTEEVFKNQLQKIEMNNIRFHFLNKNTLIFIATAANKENVKMIQKELEILSGQFFSKYSEETIKSWNGDMDVFNEFEKDLNKESKDSLKEFITQKGRGF
jgi:hypothetical protein